MLSERISSSLSFGQHRVRPSPPVKLLKGNYLSQTPEGLWVVTVTAMLSGSCVPCRGRRTMPARAVTPLPLGSVDQIRLEEAVCNLARLAQPQSK